MSRAVVIATLFSIGLIACAAPELTVDAYSDPVVVDLGGLSVDGGVFTFEVVIANTGTGDGQITALELQGDDLSFVALEPAVDLPLAVAANDVARIPVSVTNLDQLPDGWLEQALALSVTMDSTWSSSGCGGGSAPDSDDLIVPIVFAVPDGCDADDDGFRSQLCGGDDCDDTLASVNPEADEVCDFEDNDCNGQIDGADALDAVEWFADGDDDEFGAGAPVLGCVAPEPGYVELGTDCDDGNAAVFPGASEVCNDIDDDCDARVDDADDDVDTSTGDEFWADRDGDSYGDPASATLACELPVGHVTRAGDCDDVRNFVNPGELEVCDGVLDEDCDGTVDEGGAEDATIFYADRDGDGYGDPKSSQAACETPLGHVADGTDCDDVLNFIHPNAPETCNGASEDCDDQIDEGAGEVYYPDRDADGWGADDGALTSCTPITGHVLVGGDCNDLSFRFNPGVVDPCDDFRDLDCDGAPEDGCSTCLELLESGFVTSDGLADLEVDADGDGTPESVVETWCDMTTDGGGWTLAQRTVWDWAESSQLYTGFDSWANIPQGSASPGSAYRYPGALWEGLAAEGELMAVHRVRTDTNGSCDPLYYQGTGGTLTVDVAGQSASLTGLTQPVALASQSLSTRDSGPSQACVGNHSVPWFYGRCCATCATFKSTYWTDEAHPMVNYAQTTPDLFGRDTTDVCTDSPLGAANGSDFIGVDSMELYFR